MEDRDADELVLVLQGYYRLLTGQQLRIEQEKDIWTQDTGEYHSVNTSNPGHLSIGMSQKSGCFPHFPHFFNSKIC